MKMKIVLFYNKHDSRLAAVLTGPCPVRHNKSNVANDRTVCVVIDEHTTVGQR